MFPTRPSTPARRPTRRALGLETMEGRLAPTAGLAGLAGMAPAAQVDTLAGRLVIQHTVNSTRPPGRPGNTR